METCRKAPERREALRAEAAEPRSENMAEVILKNIKKVYPNSEPKKKSRDSGEKKHNLQITDEGVVAVQEFNLDIADREFIVLVGPSGCGKSTTLRMVAGLEEISAGELYIDGKLMNDVAPKDRDIAMVFQNYALYPHMTVYENMAFSLKLKKLPRPRSTRSARPRRSLTSPSTSTASQGALRRPAPARRHRPRHRARPEGVPDGRAAVEP